jgi:hypothetical protein
VEEQQRQNNLMTVRPLPTKPHYTTTTVNVDTPEEQQPSSEKAT